MERAFFEYRTQQFQAISSPGFHFPPHLHPQLELFFVEKGEVGVTVGSRNAVLAAGSLAVIFPNQIHSYRDAAPDSSITMLIASLSHTGGYLDALLHLHPASPFLTRLHPNISYAIGELVKEYGQAGSSGEVYGPLIQLILARALPELDLCQNRSNNHQDLIWQVANFVNEHYREPLTLSMLAKGVGVSPGRLSHVFSEKMGQSFPAYLSSIRLSYAQIMLQSTDMSITQVGEEAGFESQRTFFRAFRQHHGMTPLEYRRRNQKG